MKITSILYWQASVRSDPCLLFTLYLSQRERRGRNEIYSARVRKRCKARVPRNFFSKPVRMEFSWSRFDEERGDNPSRKADYRDPIGHARAGLDPRRARLPAANWRRIAGRSEACSRTIGGCAAVINSAVTKSAAKSVAQPPPIAGIGASAGGLEALRSSFRALPADTGMAFVLVQHLEPKHESSAHRAAGARGQEAGP